MSAGRRRARAGFTLVEVMVALLIFGLLATAGVALLATSASNRESVKAASDAGADLVRLHRLLKTDLGQAVDRPVWDGAGERPALSGLDGETLLTLTRAGWTASGGDREALQRVEYRLVDGRLERRVRDSLDAGDWGPPQVLMQGVGTARVRFLTRGQRLERWPDETVRASLPDAVEIEVQAPRFCIVPMAFMVGGAR